LGAAEISIVSGPSELPLISAPLPWHEREWTRLNHQLEVGQLPHALLLVGRPYTGKSQLAIALSRLLLCAHSQGSLNCGQCHACELSASGSHGDFRWVTPQEKSRVIKVDQIRDVVRFANMTAGFGLRKVIVLTPAESMNINAFNALLKSLEEPAKDTYFILVCDHLYGVPATIRSRCHILRLPSPETETCLNWLDHTTGKRDKSHELLSLSGDAPLLAQQIYQSGISEELTQQRRALEALLAGKISVQQACALSSELDTEAFLKNLTEDLQRLLGSLTLELLRSKRGRMMFVLLDEINGLRQAVSGGSNPNKQLLVEALMSKAFRAYSDDPPVI
jgi:DNA polymerase III subunit delta'